MDNDSAFELELEVISPSAVRNGDIYTDGKAYTRISTEASKIMKLTEPKEIILVAHVGDDIYIAKKTSDKLFGFEAKIHGKFNDHYVLGSSVLIRKVGIKKGSYVLASPIKQKGEKWFKLRKI